MKTYILISLLIMTMSCTKDNQQETEKELELNITKTEWYTSISNNGFGEVYLKIEGNANGELVTIETGGDGLAGCEEVKLDDKNNFSAELMILFHPNYDSIPKKYRTYVNVYEKSESPDVVYCRTGTGEKIREMIESDYLIFEK
ncbi:MAG: hypothetical protein DRJ01_16080 [Bacteroidetes bacterium]|nr:MAG: hypothetical protein DRJ01_16080 [Bacteroidota bacterium]